jgi:hypothetical protein
MLIFKSGLWNLKDQKVLAWLLEQPLKIELSETMMTVKSTTEGTHNEHH